MKRGELYRVRRPGADPKRFRTYVVVSRQALIDSKFSSVVCAPVFTQGAGLSTQIEVGPQEGLLHASWITCDQLVSVPKPELTDYVGSLSPLKVADLNRALRISLDLP
ncbi:MAG: type II toxin-antitoxin system PemK/MazF family toxin [Longimicrobiales bacterium]